MSIWDLLSKAWKFITPFLRSHAEKLVKQLPKEAVEQLTEISKMVEGVKLYLQSDSTPTIAELEQATGISAGVIEMRLKLFFEQKGAYVANLEGCLELLKEDLKTRSETGLKSLWMGLFNIIAAEITKVPWATLLLGVGQAVFEVFVKGKVKL